MEQSSEFDDEMVNSASGSGSLGDIFLNLSLVKVIYIFQLVVQDLKGNLIDGDGLWVSKNINSNSQLLAKLVEPITKKF